VGLSLGMRISFADCTDCGLDDVWLARLLEAEYRLTQNENDEMWGIYLTQVATRSCMRGWAFAPRMGAFRALPE
jgi:hypothetical protein